MILIFYSQCSSLLTFCQARLHLTLAIFLLGFPHLPVRNSATDGKGFLDKNICFLYPSAYIAMDMAYYLAALSVH
jgi:hypothetical protein